MTFRVTHNSESGTTEQRITNVRTKQPQPTRASKSSPKTPQFRSPRFNSPDRLSESSSANSTRKNAAISTKDTTADNVCRVFVEGTSVSKSRDSSKSRTTVCTREPQKTQLKSDQGKESPEVTRNSSRQVASSSTRGENVTGVDEMNFLNEVLTGNVSKVGSYSTNRNVCDTNARSPSEKKVLKKSDSNISHFIDSLIS